MLFELKMEVGGMTGMIAPPLVDDPIYLEHRNDDFSLAASTPDAHFLSESVFQKASRRVVRGLFEKYR